MSDRTRRVVCRVTFVLFCLFPTLVVVNWALFPRTTREWQAALQPQLGLLLRFERVSTRTPFKTVFTQVEVADPQRRLLTVIPQVAWSHEPTSHLIELAPFEIARDELTRGCRQLLTAALGTSLPVKLGVPSIRVVDSGSAATCTLYDCQLLLQSSAGGTALSLTFKTDPAATESVRWEFQANRNGGEDLSSWGLQTGANPLPAWLVGRELPALGSLGENATWQGQVVAYWDGLRRVHELRESILDHVDLEAGLADHFGLSVTGQARIEVPTAQLIDGRIESLVANVDCGAGHMSRGLLMSLSKWLRLQYAEPTEEMVVFSRFAFGLEIRDKQVAVRNPPQTTALLWSQGTPQPLAAAGAESQNLPVHVLGCCLARENTYAVPADSAILALIRYLPLE